MSVENKGTTSSRSAPKGYLAYLALFAAILCIGWSAIFVRWTDVPGSVSAFYRMLIPAAILFPTFFIPGKEAPLSRRSLGIIAFGGIFFALDLALYNSSILRTTAANATLLGNNSPFFVGLLTWLVFQEASTSVVLDRIISGDGRIADHSAIGPDATRQFGMGDAMAVGASLFFAMYLLATEEVRTTTGTLRFLRLAMISTTVSLFLINIALGNSFRVSDSRTWAALIGLGLISQLGGYMALTYALGTSTRHCDFAEFVDAGAVNSTAGGDPAARSSEHGANWWRIDGAGRRCFGTPAETSGRRSQRLGWP